MMRVAVIYESTRGRTKAMAEAIGEGVRSAGAECDIIDARKFKDIGDVCAVAIGSSTRVKKVLPKVKQILAGLSTLDGKPAAAFGSYGWSGEAPDIIAKRLAELGASLIENQPIKAKDYPSSSTLEQCKELGQNLAKKCA
ncbi:MAG: flavodoxin domain-containing protein [Candidatus Thorarchaeota archaeon]|jgi:flavorubredoxin